MTVFAILMTGALLGAIYPAIPAWVFWGGLALLAAALLVETRP